MRYIDIHTHLNIAAFDSDRDAAIARMRQAGVVAINVGTQYDTSRRALELAREHTDLYATVGLHPTHTAPSHHDIQELGEAGKECTKHGEAFDLEAYRTLAQNPSVVAIGECGLDFFRTTDPPEQSRQEEVFRMHIALANELNKPLMLHLRNGNGRNAYAEATLILKREAKVKGNSHFFAGSLEDAKRFWDMGYSTSFTGVLTFTSDYDELVRAAPRELIHAETDAPYVAPKPHRGSRNEPAYVVEVVRRMAELRGEEVEVWAGQVEHNAHSFFALP